MQFHELKTSIKRKKVKRVGRGGKRGTYSGRGVKGQKARAGHRIFPAERALIMRIPKLRGFKNKPIGTPPFVINVGDLSGYGSSLIDKKLLLGRKTIKSLREEVKILGMGEVKKPFTVEGLRVSKSAKKKIESAGGSVK